MRYISTFSGIEAASVAWSRLGWEAIAFSEIDPFPCEVLAARFPDVPNLGDITRVDWRHYAEGCELVVGGSPCQSFSVAGSRTGLEGESGLMYEYIRAISEIMPRWLVWENVPGALSSSAGDDFECLLGALDDLGYGLAWTVLDAQFFGVAQRRRRLFVVGCFGDVESAAEVLFDEESLRGHYPTSREKREAITRATFASLNGNDKTSNREGVLCLADAQANAAVNVDLCATLTAGHEQPKVCFSIQGNIIGRKDKNGPQGCGFDDNLSFTLNTIDRHAVAFRQNASGDVYIHQGDGLTTGALTASSSVSRQYNVAIPSPIICMADANAHAAIDENFTGTLKVGGEPPIVANDYLVRRLMPVECERLQGFPDGWTDISIGGGARLMRRDIRLLATLWLCR